MKDCGNEVEDGRAFGAVHCKDSYGYEDSNGYRVKMAIVGVHVVGYYTKVIRVFATKGGEIRGP